MKHNWKKSLELLLENEGGFTADKLDRGNKNGGSTNLGITQNVYERWVGKKVDHDVMRALTPADVGPIYKENYWKRVKADDLPSGLDFFTFSWGVNSGPGTSAKALQGIIEVVQDGGIGPKTLKALAEFDPIEVLEKMHDKRQGFYEGISGPGGFERFGKGWTARNKHELEEALIMAEG